METEACPPPLLHADEVEEDEDEEQEDEEAGAEAEEGWEDWIANDNDTGDEYVCLFCPARLSSMHLFLLHTSSQHSFNFPQLRKDLTLDFYDCLRLINFIRFQVASNTCWICGLGLESHMALLQHLNSVNHNILQKKLALCKETADGQLKHPWQDDKYLTPFLENDSFLYSFEENLDEHITEDRLPTEDVETLLSDTEVKSLMLTMHNGMDAEGLFDGVKVLASGNVHNKTLNAKETGSTDRNGHSQEMEIKSGSTMSQKTDAATDTAHALPTKKRNNLKVSFAEVAARERYSINQSYFGSYSTFGIHREMLSDKLRTDAYENAIIQNPLLLKGAVVMDLGCGTGILSLFAAKAGAKKVVAVEGSKRMALMAQQVAKANGYLNEHTEESRDCNAGGVINVVQGMIEELELGKLIESNCVDVLVSEWMGYCLLYESMLNSVLFARDRWLKPGGAILPDVAEMYVAGFGVGGTSLPFWENVYGFDMKCIGKEVLEDAASSLIVDVVESKDIVTDSCLLQAFDLVTMTESDVDFTAPFQLNLQTGLLQDSALRTRDCIVNAAQKNDECVWCYGLVIWFDTRFSNRFCQEHPVLLSTSPYSPKTHWSQTLLTFQKPVCLSVSRTPEQNPVKSEEVGTASVPALGLKGRISIARSCRHRSIDISLELVAVGASGATQEWPVQIFDM